MIASNILPFAVSSKSSAFSFFTFIAVNIDMMPTTAEAWTVQGILFGAGLLIYAVCTLLAARISVKRYEQVNVQ